MTLSDPEILDEGRRVLDLQGGGRLGDGGLLEYLSRLGVPAVALVGRTDSMLAIGHTLAVVVLRLKGFREEDFSALHPGGALGRKLSLRVADVMVCGGVSVPRRRRPGAAAARRMETHRVMALPVVNGENKLAGVVHLHDLMRSGAV